MTRKKQSFPCYGMQWGNALYLYPLEESLVEHFYQPPRPSLVNEAQMYGGRWDEPSPGVWTLTWSEQAAQDFYLNNILIHELGHLVDERNTSYIDRERYAEWFAIHYGYRKSGGADCPPAEPRNGPPPASREVMPNAKGLGYIAEPSRLDELTPHLALGCRCLRQASPSSARRASAGPGGTGSPSRRARTASRRPATTRPAR